MFSVHTYVSVPETTITDREGCMCGNGIVDAQETEIQSFGEAFMLGLQDVPYRGSTWLTWVNVACVAGAGNGKGDG